MQFPIKTCFRETVTLLPAFPISKKSHIESPDLYRHRSFVNQTDVFTFPNLKCHSPSIQILKTTPFWLKAERATVHTYCPDWKSFSFTTAQLVKDSSSVGHLAACIGCKRGVEKMSNKILFFLYQAKPQDLYKAQNRSPESWHTLRAHWYQQAHLSGSSKYFHMSLVSQSSAFWDYYVLCIFYPTYINTLKLPGGKPARQTLLTCK